MIVKRAKSADNNNTQPRRQTRRGEDELASPNLSIHSESSPVKSRPRRPEETLRLSRSMDYEDNDDDDEEDERGGGANYSVRSILKRKSQQPMTFKARQALTRIDTIKVSTFIKIQSLLN